MSNAHANMAIRCTVRDHMEKMSGVVWLFVRTGLTS